MGLNAKRPTTQTQRIAQPNIVPGNYPGRLVQLIDLGMQAQRPYKGKDKAPAQEIMLTYELADEFMKDEAGNDLEDKPRWISETLPFFGLFADKAKSTQRYYAFDPKEDFEGDFTRAIGMPINITIVNNQAADGRVFDNVANISPMRPKDAANCPELKNPTKIFDLTNPDMFVFTALPEWLQNKIKDNLEYRGSALEKAVEKDNAANRSAPKEQPAPKAAQKIVTSDVENGVEDDNPY